MSHPNCFVTAALTVAFTLLAACNGTSRTNAAAGDDPAASSPAAETDTPAAQADPQAADADTQAAAPPATPAEAAPPAETQQASTGGGQVKFNNSCRTCHSVREGDNRLGPSLHAIIGRKAGSSPGYTTYSQALASSGIVWDEAALDRFLANPDATVPGNNMKPFARIPEAAVRKEIIEYLKTAGGD